MTKRNKDDIIIKQYMNVCMLIRQNCVQSEFRLSGQLAPCRKTNGLQNYFARADFPVTVEKLYPVNYAWVVLHLFLGQKGENGRSMENSFPRIGSPPRKAFCRRTSNVLQNSSEI